MKKPNKKRTWLARALGAGAMLTTSAVACAGLLPSMNEKPMTAWAMVYGTEKPQQKPTALLFGVVQPGYSYIQASPPKSTTVTGNGAFKFFRLRPGIRGSLGPNIDYYFLAEFANNAANPDVGGINASARVMDGNVTLNYIPGVHVQVGQMLVPFGEEGATAAGVLPWINYSPATYNIDFNQVAPTPAPNGIAGPNGSGLFDAGREMGVMAFNQFVHGPMAVDYAVGYFNGTGLSQTQSSMGHPDQAFVHGGVDFGRLGIAGSYETGRQRFNYASESYHQNRYAIDVRYGNYIKDPLWLWYEYQHANSGQPAAQGNGTARGWFAAAGFHPVKKYMGVFRYSTFNTENLDSVTYSPGSVELAPAPAAAVSLDQESLVGVYLARKGVRYYVEFDHTTYNNSTLPADNAVSVMLSVPFGVRLLH
ncbi:porin [Acidiferrobacter sp.]|uniref:porin n=1 Tax=Acidiferrobacter sp. TaxID=1872107 RepID=UPI002609E927|nr:porin [Acidiferrobacter sp.]